MYLEGVRKSHRFSQTVKRVTARKPIVFLRGGLTESGGRAAASHSGAMAGRADVFLAVARHAGSLVCTDPDDGRDAVVCLANLPPARGPRVAIITLGGGWGVVTADEVVRCGRTVTGLPPGVIRALDGVLPDDWSRANPVDMVGAVAVSIALTALDVLTRSSSADAVLFMGVLGSPATGHAATQRTAAELTETDREPLTRVRSLMDVTGKPIICVPFSPIGTVLARTADGQTPVVLSSPATAVRALAGLVQCSSYRRPPQGPVLRYVPDGAMGVHSEGTVTRIRAWSESSSEVTAGSMATTLRVRRVLKHPRRRPEGRPAAHCAVRAALR